MTEMAQDQGEFPAIMNEKHGDVAALPALVGEGRRSLTLVASGSRLSESAGPVDETQASCAASVLLHAIQRLESVIDEEILALQQRQKIDFDAFSRRKNRGLLELVRSSKAAGDAGKNADVVSEVVKLRAKLEQNYTVLRLHFEAVRAVSELICRTIREAESDGTYAVVSRRKE